MSALRLKTDTNISAGVIDSPSVFSEYMRLLLMIQDAAFLGLALKRQQANSFFGPAMPAIVQGVGSPALKRQQASLLLN